MTKQDYQILAEALLAARPFSDEDLARRQWSITIRYIALELREDNPWFDKEKFFEACGGTPDGH